MTKSYSYGLVPVFVLCLPATAFAEPPVETPVEADGSETVVVVAPTRAGENSPTTKSELSEDALKAKPGQEVPFLLNETPSVEVWSDLGLPAGYSYFSVRGIHQTRLNFTLDGIPLQDGEDFGVYFSNFVDFGSSMQGVQVQRGVGLSPGGAPAYGGSVQFDSIDLASTPETTFDFGYGRFGTLRTSMSVQSGDLGHGWRGYVRASSLHTDGWRDNSAVSQGSGFFKVGHFDAKGSVRLVAFTGLARQQLAFYATEEAVLDEDPTSNPLVAPEEDRFRQNFISLQGTREVSESTNIAGSLYYNGADGWYQLFEDGAGSPMDRYHLDQATLGAFGTFDSQIGDLALSGGVHGNTFYRRHHLDVDGVEAYTNRGNKSEGSAFAKATWVPGKFQAEADVQARVAHFEYTGAVPIDPATWAFINPKAGLRYDFTPGFAAYASLGEAGREPTRNDLFLGEDEPTISHDLRAVRPEHVLDAELGIIARAPAATVALNAYAMEFRNEIASTGELSDIGLQIRKNVDRSYRRGLELDATLRPHERVTIELLGNLSQNRLQSWDQFFDVYDEAGNYLETTSKTYTDTPILFTPSQLGRARVVVNPTDALDLAVGIRHVGRSYLDNTGDAAFASAAYTTLDADIVVRLDRWAKLPRTTLQIHGENLTSARARPSGYSYRYATTNAEGLGPVGGTAYYYPKAPISWMAEVTVAF